MNSTSSQYQIFEKHPDENHPLPSMHRPPARKQPIDVNTEYKEPGSNKRRKRNPSPCPNPRVTRFQLILFVSVIRVPVPHYANALETKLRHRAAFRCEPREERGGSVYFFLGAV
jgi:hypothetical protein